MNSSIINAVELIYPRVMSQIERDVHSPLFGCCDRHFWMYKLQDFSSGIIQQSSLFFAELSQTDFSKTNSKLLNNDKKEYWKGLAKGINNFTLSIMDKNGYLDEYFPGEKSFVATGFGAYALLKSAYILNDKEILHSKKIENLFHRLLRSTSSPAANQDIACAAFIHLYARIHKTLVSEANEACARLLNRTEYNGHFSEYGGFDYGYSTVTLSYLSYMAEDGFTLAAEKIDELLFQIKQFTPSHGHEFGGEIGSRNTSYLMPFGFYFSHLKSGLPFIHQENIFRDTALKIDERYLMHYVAASFGSTLRLVLGNTSSVQAKDLPTVTTHFYESNGLFSLSRDNFSIQVNLMKGGVFNLYKNELFSTHNGYRVRHQNQVYASNIFSDYAKHSITHQGDDITIVCTNHFSRYSFLMPSTIKLAILRCLSFAGPSMNKLFKYILIKKPKTVDVTITRKIRIGANFNVEVDDLIEGIGPNDEIYSAPLFSFRTVPSAKFYYSNEEMNLCQKIKNDHKVYKQKTVY